MVFSLFSLAVSLLPRLSPYFLSAAQERFLSPPASGFPVKRFFGFPRPAPGRFLPFLALVLFLSSPAHSAQVTLQWDPNQEPSLAGYRIYYGTASGSYPYYVDAGRNTTCTLSNLQDGVTYYLAATAYDTVNQESDYSAEVTFRGSPACAFSLSPSSQSFASAGGAGTIALTAVPGCSWTAVSNASWILLTSNSSGSGSATLNYSVLANGTSASRSGTLTVAGKTFTVSQQGGSQYTLSVAKAGSGNGTVTSSPAAAAYNPGTAVTLSASADSHSTFAGWSGGCSGTSPTCSLTMSSNLAVTATFNLKTFTIQSSAGANGSISPQGTVTVSSGGSQAFTLTPSPGYQVQDVKVNGVSAGAVTSYLFSSIAANQTISATFAALVPPPDPAPVVWAINAGGPEYTDGSGVRYLADQHSVGGSTGRTEAGIRGTEADPLYQTDRLGHFSYVLPLANGTYDVTFRFAETTHSSRNRRVFNVNGEGRRLLRELDIYAAAGKNTALDFTVTVSVSDGALNLDFAPVVGDAKVNAILVKKSSGISYPPPKRLKRYFSTQAQNP